MNTRLLFDKLVEAGLPAIGVESGGVVNYSRELTPAEASLASLVQATNIYALQAAAGLELLSRSNLLGDVPGSKLAKLAIARARYFSTRRL